MYVYQKNPNAKRNVLSVMRQEGAFSDTPSCPERVDNAHVLYVQEFFTRFNAFWNQTQTASCIINYYVDRKDLVQVVLRRAVMSAEK